MKKSFVYLLAVAVMSLTLGLAAQDKMAPAGATGSTGAKKAGSKKSGTGKMGSTGSTGSKKSSGKKAGAKGATGSTGDKKM